MKRLAGLIGLMVFGAAGPTAWGQSQAWRSRADVAALSKRIDDHIARAQKEAGVVAAPPAEHGGFFRRLHLDMAGIIPTLIDVNDYIQNTDPDKLWDKSEKYLEADTYSRHFAAVLRSHMLNGANQQAQGFTPSFELWVKERLQKNVGYDHLVRELLAPGSEGVNNMRFPGGGGAMSSGSGSPAAFYIAAETKAENLAGSASRVFLGIKLDCAQCHAHPFAKWTKDEFWQFAAFFVGTQPAFNRFEEGRIPANLPASTAREITIPGTGKVVKAKFLTGEEPAWKDNVPTRSVLADWMTSPKNPYFAKATADMVWQYFFGVSLLEPIMEPSEDAPITHPQLLGDLAQSFADHDFDLKFLIRAIIHTQAYQRSSAGQVTKDDYVLLTRMPVRGMSPEQLFDSVVEAVAGPLGHSRFNAFQANNPGGRPPAGPRAEFLAKFVNQDRRHESQTTILQALFLMNGKFLADEIKNNKDLDQIAFGKESGPAEKRLSTLYRMVLSREPRPDEVARLVPYLEAGGDNQRQRVGDILWSLVNSAEFRLNH